LSKDRFEERAAVRGRELHVRGGLFYSVGFQVPALRASAGRHGNAIFFPQPLQTCPETGFRLSGKPGLLPRSGVCDVNEEAVFHLGMRSEAFDELVHSGCLIQATVADQGVELGFHADRAANVRRAEVNPGQQKRTDQFPRILRYSY
jgi:hypothetical protein